MRPGKLIIFLFFVYAFPFLADAQTNPAIFAGFDTTRRVITTAVPFMVIAPDARSGALGDLGVATSPDAMSAHWNPGKFPFIENDYGFSLSYTPWLGKIVNDMSISYASGYYKLNRERILAMSLTYFDLGKITFTDPQGNVVGDFNPTEFALDGSYAQMLTDHMSLGVSLRFIYSNLTGNVWNSTNDAQAGTSVAADIGWYYNKDL
ncbi:MAG TPA: PorV/PorQ family protein, partial [Cyclobacteriaceae bacterium]|nr:PorV/PorQ family protein [Cyclobacteriaceae bacterium]